MRPREAPQQWKREGKVGDVFLRAEGEPTGIYIKRHNRPAVPVRHGWTTATTVNGPDGSHEVLCAVRVEGSTVSFTMAIPPRESTHMSPYTCACVESCAAMSLMQRECDGVMIVLQCDTVLTLQRAAAATAAITKT